MKFRNYQKKDRQKCLDIFDGNVPHFFDINERKDFEQFLDQEQALMPYFILENERGDILGCGGYETDPKIHTAFLRWGLIANNYQGHGLGSTLLKERITQIKKDNNLQTISINTSQKAEGFYQHFGFKTKEITKDFYGPGMHQCKMLLKL